MSSIVEIEGTRLARCEDCDSVFVKRSAHDCASRVKLLTKDPAPAAIAAMVAQDDGAPGDAVVHTDSRYSSAYHETTDGESPCAPTCRNARRADGTAWVSVDRADAQKNRFPCTRCHDIDVDAVIEEAGIDE